MEVEPGGTLRALQRWYVRWCDGEWEHQYGVKIDTLDNPGWMMTIDLHGTPLANATLPRTLVERSENDWLSTGAEGGEYRGACGPLNLEELIDAFLRWTREQLPESAAVDQRSD